MKNTKRINELKNIINGYNKLVEKMETRKEQCENNKKRIEEINNDFINDFEYNLMLKQIKNDIEGIKNIKLYIEKYKQELQEEENEKIRNIYYNESIYYFIKDFERLNPGSEFFCKENLKFFGERLSEMKILKELIDDTWLVLSTYQRNNPSGPCRHYYYFNINNNLKRLND